MKDCNAFCIAFICLKLLLSKILLFSHFVGEPNNSAEKPNPVEFHPRNSNSWTFLDFSILLFFLLYLYLILKGCLCLCHCKQSVPSHPVTQWYLLYNKAWVSTNCKPLELGVSLLIHLSIPWPFLFTLSRFIRLFAFSDFTFLQCEIWRLIKGEIASKKIIKNRKAKLKETAALIYFFESLRSPFSVLALQIQPKLKWRGIVDAGITYMNSSQRPQ